MKFNTISKILNQYSFYEPVDPKKKSKTDPFHARTVQQIISDYIDVNTGYTSYPSGPEEYDDFDAEPEPNNKDLSYVSDNLDLINSINNNVQVKDNKDSNNSKEEENESNQDSGSSDNRSDIVSQEASTN